MMAAKLRHMIMALTIIISARYKEENSHKNNKLHSYNTSVMC